MEPSPNIPTRLLCLQLPLFQWNPESAEIVTTSSFLYLKAFFSNRSEHLTCRVPLRISFPISRLICVFKLFSSFLWPLSASQPLPSIRDNVFSSLSFFREFHLKEWPYNSHSDKKLLSARPLHVLFHHQYRCEIDIQIQYLLAR